MKTAMNTALWTAAAIACICLPCFGQVPSPNLDHCVWVSLEPGERFKITTSFDCGWENCLRVLEHYNSAEVLNHNSHPPEDRFKAGTWESPANNTDGLKTYIIQGLHKESPGDGRLPWLHSGHIVLGESEASSSIGFEDWNDNDYNDAAAVIVIKKGDQEQKLSVTTETPQSPLLAMAVRAVIRGQAPRKIVIRSAQ